MFKWKRKHEGNKFEYMLVLDDRDKKRFIKEECEKIEALR